MVKKYTRQSVNWSGIIGGFIYKKYSGIIGGEAPARARGVPCTGAYPLSKPMQYPAYTLASMSSWLDRATMLIYKAYSLPYIYSIVLFSIILINLIVSRNYVTATLLITIPLSSVVINIIDLH